jgi:hypothetical protein
MGTLVIGQPSTSRADPGIADRGDVPHGMKMRLQHRLAEAPRPER